MPTSMVEMSRRSLSCPQMVAAEGDVSRDSVGSARCDRPYLPDASRRQNRSRRSGVCGVHGSSWPGTRSGVIGGIGALAFLLDAALAISSCRQCSLASRLRTGAARSARRGGQCEHELLQLHLLERLGDIEQLVERRHAAAISRKGVSLQPVTMTMLTSDRSHGCGQQLCRRWRHAHIRTPPERSPARKPPEWSRPRPRASALIGGSAPARKAASRRTAWLRGLRWCAAREWGLMSSMTVR